MTDAVPFASRRDILVGGVGAAVFLSGCSGRNRRNDPVPDPFEGGPAPDHAALVKAAQRERLLTIYSAANARKQDAVAAAFGKKYGIDVVVYRLLYAELDHKVHAERTAGIRACDVVCGTSPLAFADFREKGWLAPIAAQERSSFDWPGQFWNGYWATVVVNFHGISYNSRLVTGGRIPRSWADLLDPYWTGRILLIDPRTGIQSQIMYDLLLKREGVEFLRRLGRQGTVSPSGTPALQEVGAGASLAFCPTIPPPFEAAKSTGMPIEIVYPELKSYSAIVAAAIANSPHPNAAKLYIDYVMSAEGQALLNEGSSSPLPDVPGTRPLPASLVDPDYAHAAANSRTIIEALTG